MPIFINKKTKEPLRDKKVIEKIASIYEKQGSDCWFTDDPKVFLGDEYNSEDYQKLNDIVEVWFDSGSTHSFVLEKRRFKMACRYVFRRFRPTQRLVSFIFIRICGTRGKAPSKVFFLMDL